MRDRAAYMREYRARRKRGAPWSEIAGHDFREVEGEAVLRLTAENDRLRDEVAHIKRLLADHHLAPSVTIEGEDWSHTVTNHLATARPFVEFRPVPKPGKGK